MASTATMAMVGRLGGWLRGASAGTLDDYLKNLHGKITAAGVDDRIKAEQLLGIQVLSALAFPAFWIFVFASMPGLFGFLLRGPAQIVTYLVLIAAGFYFPYMNVRDRMLKRQKKILLSLPDAIDLLTISVEAGLDFMGAMRRVVEKQPAGPLREEMERFFKEVELGKTRRDGLKELSLRVQLSDLSSIVSSLVQADRLGASIGPILRVQSDMLRIRRGQRAEKSAMEAPVKMLAPLLLCIFPAVFVVLFTPLFIQMISDIMR